MKITQNTKTHSIYQYVVNDTFEPHTCLTIFPRNCTAYNQPKITIANTDNIRKLFNRFKRIVEFSITIAKSKKKETRSLLQSYIHMCIVRRKHAEEISFSIKQKSV